MAVDWTSGAGTGWLQNFDRAVSTCGAALLDNFVAERVRWPLWSPVLLGCGIGSYFALPTEPPSWLGAAVLGIAVVVALLGRHSPPVLLLGLAAALAAGGFSAAQWRSVQVAAPMLEKRFGPADVTGQVIRVESLPNGPRVLLGDVSLAGIASEETPRHVRIRLRRDDSVAVGDRITVLAKLSPPSAPVAPGAYDFRRHLWFEGIGSIGYAYGTARKLTASKDGRGSFSLWLAASRQTITDRIRAVVPGAAGAVTAALIVGDRSGIPEADNVAMRDSGLAHLLSISGLHMGFVASILFFGIRGLLALWERAALRWPIKKWAAAAAIAGSFAYLLISGADVPAQRSFVMTGVVLLAVVLDRTAISLRLVAWAAMIVLLIAPESLLGPSFQMSFGAVVALVATYEAWRPQAIRRDTHRPGKGSLVGRLALYLLATVVTTVVAGSASGVIALYHFDRVAYYGLAANLIAVPLTGFWIMPWAVVACALMPFGLDAFALAPMGWGVEIVLRIAEAVSSWKGAVGVVPAMPTAGIVLIAAGGLWLCLWQRPWRLFGILGIAAGLLTIPLASRPDILVSGTGELIAVRLPDDRLGLSTTRRERFTAEIWLRRNGQAEPLAWTEAPETPLSCDALGCIYRVAGETVALVRDGRALADDCRTATVVVSVVPVRGRCPSARLVVDRFDLWRAGAHAIRLAGGRANVETVADDIGRRPWTPFRERR